jgi:hypothetical protein
MTRAAEDPPHPAQRGWLVSTVTAPPRSVVFERDYAVGQRVNLGDDDCGGMWIRATELRRTDERAGEVEYLLAFGACDPPAPPN